MTSINFRENLRILGIQRGVNLLIHERASLECATRIVIHSIFVPSDGPLALWARLQRVQSTAARLIHNASRTSPSSPLLINLHWLPVKFRIIFKILLITFKAINSLAPEYITQLIKVKHPNVLSDFLMPSSSSNLPYTIQTSKTLGDRSFCIAALVEWNQLPANIRNASSIPHFKTLLKAHLSYCTFAYINIYYATQHNSAHIRNTLFIYFFIFILFPFLHTI